MEVGELEQYRELADELIRHACDSGDGKGRGIDDPVYAQVASMQADRDAGRSRNRTSKKEGWFFSSCAFLCHWWLESAFPDAIAAGALPWVGREKQKINPLSRLIWGHGSRAPTRFDVFQPGDILCCWPPKRGNKAHIFVALEHDPESGTLVSGDYGQPGGRICTRKVRWTKRGLKIGKSRYVYRVMMLSDVRDMVAEFEPTEEI